MAQKTSRCHKFPDRISKQDLFACLALWMEESPLATSAAIINDNDMLTTSSLKRKTMDDMGVCHTKKQAKIEKTEDQALSEQVSIDKPSQENDLNMFIKKEDDCMEVLEKKKCKTNKVGAVIVDQNENIVAVNCSRQGVHAVVNALVMQPGIVKGCAVYVSRKPCSVCTKFMAQMGVSRVYYLPLEPELPWPEDLKQAEQIYRACCIAQSIYIPRIDDNVIEESIVRQSPYTLSKADPEAFTQVLINHYWSQAWVNRLPTVLLWPDFTECSQQVSKKMSNMFEWLANVTLVDIPESTSFHAFEHHNGLISPRNVNTCQVDDAFDSGQPSIPSERDFKWQQIARHMSRMAHMVAQRSDDPTRGVGAVVIKENEVVAIGWNGFPSKAMYGDFPRAADSDKDNKSKKYPFSIHAEQSCILTRLLQDMRHRSTTMFVSKMPCDECVPIMMRVGIRNVVFPPAKPKQHSTHLKYGLIGKLINGGYLNGFLSSSFQNKDMQTVTKNLLSGGTEASHYGVKK